MDPVGITQVQPNELLEAQSHIWKHTFSFLNSMALKCALELGIPDAIQRHVNPITLNELIDSLPIHPTKVSSFHRLMRFLCHAKFFSREKLVNGEEVFALTINSKLLLKDHPLTLAPFMLAMLNPSLTNPGNFFSCWFKNEQQSPFNIAHDGRNIWEHASVVGDFNEYFSKAMSSDARFVAAVLKDTNIFKEMFNGIKSLVDVGGGDGTMAKVIAKANPKLKCVVFDLPHVVNNVLNENDGDNLVYVGGDMFEAIPPADVLLLKWILHDWSDEQCVKILERCKEAISTQNRGGKLIIIDVVVKIEDETLKDFNTQFLLDMEMMSLSVGGKERTENEWKKLFISAGFSDYKILPVLGLRSIIEVYPLSNFPVVNN